MFKRLALLAAALALPAWCAGSTPWDLNALERAPQTFDAPGFHEPGVKAVFYQGPPYKGKPTRVFAWYAIPSHRPGERVPGIVLVHGGGGTAFAEWVRLWNPRGYAAIAMDTCGSVPAPPPPGKPYSAKPVRDADGGPPGWDASFDQIAEPIADQWPYHAVADIILANSLLRSFPDVDPNRIGITGISWGGYLTSIVAGVDHRFRFAAPVYGCGFLGEDSVWLPRFREMGPAKSAKWLTLWDPSVYLPAARMPMLWVAGTNDFAYPLSSLRKSYLLPKGKRVLAIRIRMPHDHADGAAPEEIHAFADSIVRGVKPAFVIQAQGRHGETAWLRFHANPDVARAELNFTKDDGPWKERRWETMPMRDVSRKGRIEAALPPGVRAYYFNLFDARGLVTSSELVTTN